MYASGVVGGGYAYSMQRRAADAFRRNGRRSTCRAQFVTLVLTAGAAMVGARRAGGMLTRSGPGQAVGNLLQGATTHSTPGGHGKRYRRHLSCQPSLRTAGRYLSLQILTIQLITLTRHPITTRVQP